MAKDHDPGNPDAEEEPSTKGGLVPGFCQWIASEAISNALVPLLSWTMETLGNVLGWVLELLTL